MSGECSMKYFQRIQVVTWLTSATLVAATIFQEGVGSKTRRCSSFERFAWSGRTFACLVFRRLSMHCLISWTPGRKIRIPPGFSALETMWETIELTSYPRQWVKIDHIGSWTSDISPRSQSCQSSWLSEAHECSHHPSLASGTPFRCSFSPLRWFSLCLWYQMGGNRSGEEHPPSSCIMPVPYMPHKISRLPTYISFTGCVKPGIFKRGALSKYLTNISWLMVADIRITFSLSFWDIKSLSWSINRSPSTDRSWTFINRVMR